MFYEKAFELALVVAYVQLYCKELKNIRETWKFALVMLIKGAGEVHINDDVKIEIINNNSGHYQPNRES
ncbi:hypothetical protein LVD17_14670 [Fulvivirga ulvae]|uniref:hypothetical protein n=1 Tax=Fulvivirga ulvae TaxID=2904245 RepID=UPI001F226016|nr:hypothetical protein [Fulvivirga ulvae]UII35050.1 hypothetical protein LVD17_14670 [Fulvivirga ulvae]